MSKRKRPLKAAALTLEDLDGDASKRVSFLRTDARAAIATVPTSMTALKEAFVSELEPKWVAASGELAAAVLRQIGHACAAVAPAHAPQRQPLAGIHLGRSCVCRALKRRALRAVVLAREAGPPLLYAHLAALAQEAGATVALLACSSAHLGQPFGLLRASAVGLDAELFPEAHPLVALVEAAAGTGQRLPWLTESRAPSRQSSVKPLSKRSEAAGKPKVERRNGRSERKRQKNRERRARKQRKI